ncbi:MAG: hypothetical protein RSC51_07600, partial [Oscillospiraceae bacterium]
MKKHLTTLLMLALSLVVIIAAALIPNAIFGNSQSSQGVPPDAMDANSPVGVMRGEFLARALGSEQSFQHSASAEANEGERTLAVKAIYELLSAIGAPQYMLEEMDGLYRNASIISDTIHTKSGAKLPLIHLYLEWNDDWSNWIEVYVDAESGKVLYFYASGRCVTGSEKYTSLYPQMPTSEQISEAYGKYCGYVAQKKTLLPNPNENALIASYSDEFGSADYKINCIYYAGNMYDIKISPLPQS